MQLVSFFLILLFGFSHCVNHLPKGVYFISLDSSANISMYWSLDYNQKYVRFEIHLPLRRWDWFAIGFSDYGELYQADLCILWSDRKWNTEFQDVWTDEIGDVHLDEKQNCEDFDIDFHDHLTKFTFSRKFDTCDEFDYVIEDGTTHIVWMKGNGLLTDVEGRNVDHASKHGMQRTQLLKNPELQKIKFPQDTRTVEFTADRVQVPGDDTTYWCYVQKIPEFLSKIHHVIQFEAVIQSGNEGLVHHMELFHCEAAYDKDISSYNGPCTHADRPKDTEICKKVLAAWAMGATPFLYPKEAGLPIGGKRFNPYVMLEVHYNNPEMKSDFVDSSGVRLHITPTLRKYNAGVMELGLEYTDKMAIPPKQESFLLSGYCISECTAVSLPPQGITIFGSQLHTHLTGVQVLTRHIRDGRELPELNRDNHYSTHFQEIRLLKRPVNILPGDALITTCRYKTEQRENITLGGFSIKDEMCVNYVHYYPKIELEVCKSSISYQTLFTYFRYLNEWENQNTNSQYGISTNYGNINWNQDRVTDLQSLFNDMTLSMQCNASTGLRFPGDWENVPSTHVLYPLPPPIRSCKQDELIV
ncbi:dopamine beta-hydroxylase-like [Planococcus citri]|uniref:dopamine beta-hydroxylase-like n=1 Tax=Planococcus citri TaxID=170843 RepID=UPI0031F9D20F